jgi:prefoldin subunit 5
MEVLAMSVEMERELAVHGNEIRHLQRDIDTLVAEMAAVRKSLEHIDRTLSQAQGGWKALMWAGGAIGAITGFVGYISGYLTGK